MRVALLSRCIATLHWWAPLSSNSSSSTRNAAAAAACVLRVSLFRPGFELMPACVLLTNLDRSVHSAFGQPSAFTSVQIRFGNDATYRTPRTDRSAIFNNCFINLKFKDFLIVMMVGDYNKL